MDPSASTSNAPLEKSMKTPAPYVRIDTLKIKQQLHDVLGENGLPYWQALVSFLTGKIGREELDGLVDGWLGGTEKRLIPLHNHLLISLISNASNSLPTTPVPSSVPVSTKRARRPDDPTPYGAKRRVLGWVLGMPKRERERVRTTQLLGGGGGGEDSDEEGEEGGQQREERRKGGAGWMGGSEMERERPVLGPANRRDAVGTSTEGGSSTPHTPTHGRQQEQNLPIRSALENRCLPSSEQIRDRMARIAAENGLDTAGPGVGSLMGLAVETHLKTLISTHLHLHRSNLLSSPSIHPSTSSSSSSKPKPKVVNAEASTSTLVPSLIHSTPTSPSASSTGPQTPPNTFSLHALQGVLDVAPGMAMDLGSVSRVVGSRLLDDEAWGEMWKEAERENMRWKDPEDDEQAKEEKRKKEEKEERERKEAELVLKAEGTEGVPEKKKKKDHAYDYVDPRTILDSLLD
ncbi:transcriptional regulator of RNA polII, SAGA, subunit-domain-containing protein [Mrakia frigida]|uniref:transcriptional regulator of RNA polII, SAGA, subunit-domain-containing protein n=1 Tax=Mrakia frigida TaxID=29902 RepID=UPI003FCBF2E0